MEVIRIAGYTVEEKVEIAWRYLLPRLLEEHGITDNDLQFTDEVLGFISSRYSREAGLRNFERNLAAIMRKRARRKAEGEEGAWVIDLAKVEEILGVAALSVRGSGEGAGDRRGDRTRVDRDRRRSHGDRGAADARHRTTHRHRPARRRDARVGRRRAFLRALACRRSLGIDDKEFKEADLHIHFPAGAIPKDGPSAGIAVTLAIASVLSRRAVRRDVAMTGEVTLRGKVLEIGGVKEKVLAAYRAGLREVILPKIQREGSARCARRSAHQHGVHVSSATMDDVIRIALLPTGRRPRSPTRRHPRCSPITAPRGRGIACASSGIRTPPAPAPTVQQALTGDAASMSARRGVASRGRDSPGHNPWLQFADSGCHRHHRRRLLGHRSRLDAVSSAAANGSASRARSPRISRGSPRASARPSASGCSRRTT